VNKTEFYKHHYHRVHRRLRGVRVARRDALPAGTALPGDFAAAYGFGAGCCADGQPVKIGILSLGGSYVASDLEQACQQAGIPLPTVEVLIAGGATQDPTDQDSNVENALDLQCAAAAWSRATNKAAQLVIAFGPNGEGGMLAALQALVAAGCRVISISWGGPASSWSSAERAGLAEGFASAVAAGVTVLAASGDNSEDDGTSIPTADYPCSDPNVWAVGGTSVMLSPTGGIMTESAWGDGQPGDEGGGGGFDPWVAQPGWQAGSVPTSSRGVPDTSANADPNTGYRVVANGALTVVGGTSGSTPLTAGLVAAAKSVDSTLPGLLTPRVYRQVATACRDITTGSDGYPAAPGWDPATGCGSPNGVAFIAALRSTEIAVKSPPLPAPAPHPTVGPVTLAQATAWATAGLMKLPLVALRSSAVQAVVGSLSTAWPKGQDAVLDTQRPEPPA